jgi:hypothetical protein
MAATTEKPTLLVLHYKGWRGSDQAVAVPNASLNLVDLEMPRLRFNRPMSYGTDPELQNEFRGWVAEQPNAVVRALIEMLSDWGGKDIDFARQVLRNKLHQRKTASDPAGPFVLEVREYAGSQTHFVAGSSDVDVVHIDVSDLRTTTRIGHFAAIQKARALPPSLQGALRERMQNWQAALRTQRAQSATEGATLG